MSGWTLNHIAQIRDKIEVLHRSRHTHALILLGAAGWGKSRAVEDALKLAGIKAINISAYSTPLNLFRVISENPKSILILDDTAGLFTDRAAMAILKAATWSSRERIVSWGSTTTRVNVKDFEFCGKLVIIANHFPSSDDAMAVKSRSLTHYMDVYSQPARELLKRAGKDPKWFEDVRLSSAVADFLCARLTPSNLDQISYRMLHIGYDLAIHKPNDWQRLLSSMLHIQNENPREVVAELSVQGLKVREQVGEFERLTGLKRRTFFKYRKVLGLLKNDVSD